MKNLAKTIGIIVIVLSAASCATTVAIKSVRMPTINGMNTIKNLGIKEFENKSGVRGSLGAELTNYLSDNTKRIIQNTGKFITVNPADPNADGVFFGEIRSISSEDSQSQYEKKDKEGNVVTITTYTRKVTVAFVYGVKSSRTNTELGTISKQGTESSSSTESSDKLTAPLALARKIVDYQLRSLVKDIVPTIVSENRKLMSETSKDKTLKQLMKEVEALVKNRNYEEAIRQYDEIDEQYGSVAARTNAGILRQSIASDTSASAQMAQLDSERSGYVGKAAQSAVDALNSRLPSGVIMIMKMKSTEPNMLDDVVDRIITNLVQTGKLKIVDRSNQVLIDAEQQFQLSGNVDDDSMISIGHQLGSQYAVLCWISGTLSNRKLNLRVLNIETAQIIDQNSFDI